jgi:hypothetical protein
MALVIKGDIDGGAVVNHTTDEDIHVTGKIDGGSTATLVSNRGSIVIDGKVDGGSTARLHAAKDIRIGVVGSDGDKKIDGGSQVTAKACGSIFLGNKIDGSSKVTANSGSRITLVNKIDGSSTVDFQACGRISIGDKIDGGSTVRLSVKSGTIEVQDKIDNGSTEVQFFPAGSLHVGTGIHGGANVHVEDWAHNCIPKYSVVLMLWGPPQPPHQHTKPKWPSTLTGKELRQALAKIAKTTYFHSLAQYNVKKVSIAAGDPPQFPNGLKHGTKKYTTRFTMKDVVNVVEKSFSKDVPAPDSFKNSIPVYIVITPRGGLMTDDRNALGEHSAFSWGSSKLNVLYAYVGAQKDLNDTLKVATHEIVEAVGDNGCATKELCDACATKYGLGVKTGIASYTVASYFDAKKNKCVAPPGFAKPA